jgi:hypothetical protein
MRERRRSGVATRCPKLGRDAWERKCRLRAGAGLRERRARAFRASALQG